jgi:hypothetical protein
MTLGGGVSECYPVKNQKLDHSEKSRSILEEYVHAVWFVCCLLMFDAVILQFKLEFIKL